MILTFNQVKMIQLHQISHRVIVAVAIKMDHVTTIDNKDHGDHAVLIMVINLMKIHNKVVVMVQDHSKVVIVDHHNTDNIDNNVHQCKIKIKWALTRCHKNRDVHQ